LEKIYKQGEAAMALGNKPEPALIEVSSIAECALNYMHTGNASVIAMSVMNPLWIGRAVIQDGIPYINPGVVRIQHDTPLTVDSAKWPYDQHKHQPKTASSRSQILMYGQGHFNVSLALLIVE
jgi:hypothetical protein